MSANTEKPSTPTTSTADPKSITDLWASYKNGGADALTALDEIKLALHQKLNDNPQAAALVASQIIGESAEGSDSENMAVDVFKRAAACVELQNPMTLVNMFHGCGQRMKPEQAERITREARSFLGQISNTAPRIKH